MTRFTIGARVVVSSGEKGTIVAINSDPEDPYSIRVRFDNGEYWWCIKKYLKAINSSYPNLF